MLTSVGRCWLLTLRDIHQAGSHDEITARCLRNSTLIPQKECGAASKVSSTTLMMFARPRESLDFYFSFFRDRVVYTLTSRVLSIEIPHIFLFFYIRHHIFYMETFTDCLTRFYYYFCWRSDWPGRRSRSLLANRISRETQVRREDKFENVGSTKESIHILREH